MKTIGITDDAAEYALVVWARHVPDGVELGRPLVATRDQHDAVQLVTDLACWWVDAAQASRLLPLGDGRAELTTWRHGHEHSRTIGATTG
ncbi:MAG: hypothetical protein GEV09_05870 [Pseudonocardiaceae bacterium]|nr:hypothetical protein [Pseudonocardiaceae bacterium]